MDYESLNIKPKTKERLMQHKQHPRDTQDDVVNHVLDMVEGDSEPTEPVPIEDVVREIAVGELREKLDRNYEAIQEATDAAQKAEKKMENLP